MSFLLTGQTDAGKSTISGHLLFLAKYFEQLEHVDDQKTFQKLLRPEVLAGASKSKWSILMDLMDGEVLANKTKTQECSVHHFRHEQKSFTLIDTPGHQLFLRNLIQGLFHLPQLDVLCLVVSSLTREFEEAWHKGTTRENLLVGRAVGCKHLLVLWNKDDVEHVSETNQQIVTQFVKALRFQSVRHQSVSGYTGQDLLTILEHVDRCRLLPLSKPVENTQLCRWVHAVFFVPAAKSQAFPLITPGFRCILHHASGEYEVEIEEFGIKMLRVQNSTPVRVLLSFSTPLTGSIGQSVLFRNPQQTLGFGKLE